MYKWGVAILILIALGINHKISHDIIWQDEAIAEWEKCIDPLYMPKYVKDQLKLWGYVGYVIAMNDEIKRSIK